MILNNPICSCDHIGCCNSDFTAERDVLNERLREWELREVELMVERDTLKAEVERLRGELDGNQAKLDDSQIECGKAQDDRDHWKALALEAMGGLKYIGWQLQRGSSTSSIQKEVRKALAAFPAEGDK